MRAMRRWMVVVLLLAGGALLFGCQRSRPSPVQPASVAVTSVADLKAEGDRLLRLKQFAAAAAKYETAVGFEPENVPLRYVLATALSYLDRRPETVQHFRWVVRHGRPQSNEVRLARQWLVTAGELSARAGADPPAAAATEATSKVRGKTEWNGIEPQQRLVPLQIVLEEEATRQVKFARRFRLGEPYEFRNIPAGTYRLVARAETTRLWEQRVTVEAGKETVLDLTPSNSSVPADQFPPR